MGKKEKKIEKKRIKSGWEYLAEITAKMMKALNHAIKVMKGKKVFIIGTTAYLDKMKEYQKKLYKRGVNAKIPKFDHDREDELAICEKNREGIEWADEVHIFWDQRSMGTIFDFGMAFALRKPIKIIYLEKKTFAGVMKKYEKICQKNKKNGIKKESRGKNEKK